MSVPPLTVVLPVRNAQWTIGRAVASLARQDLQNFQLIVVDDGSEDHSVDIARQVWGQFRSDRDFTLLQPGRVGLVAALNKGLEASSAEFVARMDADDLAHPQRLFLQLALIQQERLDVVGCAVRTFRTGGEAAGVGEGYRRYERWLNALCTHEAIDRERFIESPMAHPTVLLRREAILRIGAYRDGPWPEDYDLWLRALHRGLRFAKVDARLLLWRDHERRTSRRDARYSEEAFLRCKAIHLCEGPLASGRRAVIWGGRDFSRRLGRALLQLGVSLRAFVDIDPRRIGGQRCGVPVIAPNLLEPREGEVMLGAVGARGAREQIRQCVTSLGYTEGDDFFCVA